MKALLKIFILLFIPTGYIQAQTDVWPEWENYVNTQKVLDILVDGDNLWLATHGGLIRISKSTGERVVYNKGNSNIPGNRVNSIEIDTDGNIWLTCQFYGIAMFDGNNFLRYNKGNSSIPINQWNRDIKIDSKGNKWFGSISNIVKFDGKDSKIWPTGSPISSSNFIRDIFIHRNDEVWVAGEWGAAIIYNDTLRYLKEIAEGINFITTDRNGNIWLGGNNNFLMKYSNKQFQQVNLTVTSPTDVLTFLEVDENNNFWIATSAGLVKYSKDSEILYTHQNDLPLTGVTNITADENDLWIATVNNGLYNLHDDTITKVSQTGLNEIAQIFVINDIELYDNSIYFVGMLDRVIKKDQKNYWSYIDTTSGATDKYNYVIKSNESKLLKGSCCDNLLTYIENDSVIIDTNFHYSAAVYDIIPTGENSYWLGTSKGLIRYENGTATVYDSSNSPLRSNKINDIEFDKDGNLWGTYYKGIFKFENGHWTILNTISTPVLNYNITKIKIDSENNIWINALDTSAYNLIGPQYGNGISMFDGSDWHNYNIKNSDLPSNTVLDFLIDEEDNVWCGTFVGGLSKLDKKGNWTIFNVFNSGLAHNDISALELVPEGELWIGQYRGGISVLDLQKLPSGNTNILKENINTFEIYPNPFRYETRLKFNVEKNNSHVSIKVLDINGRLLETVFSNRNCPAGYREVNWQNDRLKSGMYLFNLTINGNSQSKKILIL